MIKYKLEAPYKPRGNMRFPRIPNLLGIPWESWNPKRVRESNGDPRNTKIKCLNSTEIITHAHA